MMRILYRQTWNAWRQLGLWHQLQNVLIWGFIVLFSSNYFKPVFQSWQNNNPARSLLILNGLLLYLLLAFSIFLSRTLARQLPLSLLRPLPLSGSELFKLFIYYLHKNWLWGWIFFALYFLTELRIHWQMAIYLSGFFMVLVLIFTFFSIASFLKCAHRRITFYLMQGGTILLLGFGSYLWRYSNHSLLIFDLLLAGLLLIAGFLLLPKTQPALDELYPLSADYQQKKKRHDLPQKSGGIWPELVKRDFLNLWRNPGYRRNKLWMALGIPLLGFVLFDQYKDQAVNLFTLLVFILVWWHYSQFFAPQFGQREPEWFFKGQSLPFLPYLSAKFVVEFLFVLIVLALFSLTLHFNHIPLVEHWQLLLFLLFASGIVLTSMISFQIIFFDDPRTAGYAFHFSILFLLILTLWDHFLGPLVTIVFLTFYLFKSYRFLRS